MNRCASPDSVHAAKSLVRAIDVRKEFPTKSGRSLLVLDSVSLAIPDGAIFAVVGPSGCGKTTLLRIMSGLTTPSSGFVSVGDTSVTSTRSDVLMVFQDYNKSLFPWRTVRENVEFGLHGLSRTKEECAFSVSEYLELVGLSDFSEEYPWHLSGGMQQRVALARALIRKPKLLLMDEPFGSLDAHTRYELEDQVLSLANTLKITLVIVTHDIDEAVYLSDCVVALSARPARVLETKVIGLKRPRDQSQTRSDPTFGRIRGELFDWLRNGSD